MYIQFRNKDWSYNGDRGTWARENSDGSVTIKRAAKGIISSAFTSEMTEYCKSLGIDFADIRCGQSVTVKK